MRAKLAPMFNGFQIHSVIREGVHLHTRIAGEGAPLLLLRTMLGLEPHEQHLAVDPRLPVGMGRIEVLDIPGRWGRVDAFARGRLDLDELAD